MKKINYCIDCLKKDTKTEISLTAKRCGLCEDKHHSLIIRGKKNGRYIDGRSFEKYPKEFTPKLRETIRKRDNYKCQGKDCSITQEEHFLIYGRDIEIHHINYDKQNCKENNLISLCKQCNMRANFNRVYWKKYFKAKLMEAIK